MSQEDAAKQALEATVSLSLRVLKVAMIVLAGLFLSSGLFTVEPHEVALVRRLGRVLGTADTRVLKPGAHWAWPVLDEVVRVPALRVERLVTDLFALAPSKETLAGKPAERKGGIDPARDGYLLSGDANVVHATLAMRWQIDDPYAFALRARGREDAEAVAKPLLERAASRNAAGFTIDDLLAAKRDVFLEKVRTDVQDGLNALALGVRVLGVDFAGDVQPPPQVREAFASVAKAIQDRDRLVNEARSQAAAISGGASSEAARIGEQAISEARRLRGDLDADVAVFHALLPEWRRNPSGVESRLLTDVLAQARPEEVFVLRPGENVRVRLERDVKAVREELLRRAKGGEK